jgi:putative transposase
MIYRHGSHSTYDMKYHLVFCTKYRVLTGQVAIRVRNLIKEICSTHYVDIISGNVSPDHIHLLISAPPN